MITLTESTRGGSIAITGLATTERIVQASGTFDVNNNDEFILTNLATSDKAQKKSYNIGKYTNVVGYSTRQELFDYLLDFFGKPADSGLEVRVESLENQLLKVAYYEPITETSGQISVPQGATILLDQWANGVDAVLSEIVGGQPNYEDTGLDCTLDISGNYTVSGTLPSNPSALIYYFSIALKDLSNLDVGKVIEYVNLSINADNIPLTNIDFPTDTGATHIDNGNDWLKHIWSAGGIIGFEYTDNGDGTFDIAKGEALLRSMDSNDSPIVLYGLPQALNITIPDGAVRYVIADYNGGTPITTTTADLTTVACQSSCLLYVVSRVGINLDHIDILRYNVDFMSRYARKLALQSWLEYGSGSLTAEVGIRQLYVTSGIWYIINNLLACQEFNTSTVDTFISIYRDGAGGYTYTTGNTIVSNTEYDDSTGTLASIIPSRYVSHYLYLKINNPCELALVYGQNTYTSLAEAEAESEPAEIPVELMKYGTGVLIAKVIVRAGTSNIIEILNPFETKFTSSLATSHNALALLQGGAANEYYHLTQQKYNDLLNGFENTLNVAKSGGDYTTIKEANDFVTAQTPSSTNRWTINVHAGIYNEANPINCNPYTTIQGVGTNNTVRVVASNPTSNLFILNQASFLHGLSLNCASAACVYNNGAYLLGLREITILDSLYGVRCNNADSLLNITELTFITLATPTTTGVYIESCNQGLINTIFVVGQSAVTTLFNIDGVDNHIIVTNLNTESPNVDTVFNIDNGAFVGLKESHLDNMNYGIKVQGTNTRLQATGIEIIRAATDGILLPNLGTDVSISFNGSIVRDSGVYDVNALNPNATLSGTGELGINKVNTVEGTMFYATIVDLTAADEGTNIFGELRQGTPLNPAESTFGGGDSYTRGMLVYTFDGTSTYVNETVAASSAFSSTFTYPNTNPDAAIYCASAINRDGDYLKHLGIKLKTGTAATLGTGNFIVEFWNGVSWENTHWMVTESESPYYSKAESIFEELGDFQVFYDISLALNTSTWTKSDPVSLGVALYWIRIRIENAITTAPILQQIKLHSNNFEIEKDGFPNHRGTSRPIKQLNWSIDDAKAWQSSPSNQDLYVLNSADGTDFDLGVGREENEFISGVTDKISFGLPLPLDFDTSCPIIVEIYYHVNNSVAGNINWKTSKGITGIGETIGNDTGTAPTTIRDYETTNDSVAVIANTNNELKYLKQKIYVSKAIARKETDGSSDIITVAFNRDGSDAADTYSGNLSIYQVRALYYAWNLGGHKL